MTKYIDPKLSQETLETYQGYSLQVFTSGRIKLSFHKSHKDRVEYYAVKPKRSREAYKRQYDRSALTKPEHYQLIEELLAEHPNSLIYRVHLKGDINATTDNAHAEGFCCNNSIYFICAKKSLNLAVFPYSLCQK